jgi:UDP-glucose 4-epimerase
MSFRNQTILVTGGAGFIGSHLADKLLSMGAEKVTVLDTLVGSQGSERNILHLKKNPRFWFVRGSITDAPLVDRLVGESDIVFSEAASKLTVSLANPRLDVMTNVLGTFNVLESVQKHDARLIHASTGSVFGSAPKPFAEDDAKRPSTVYGISKLAGESYILHFARETGVKATVIRYFHVYGPRQDYAGDAGVVSIFLSRVLKGRNPVVYGTGKQIRCFTFVSDDVNATLLLAKKKRTIGEAYNVASHERVSVKELAELVVKRYGSEKQKVAFGPARSGENMRPIPDTRKIEKLGFEVKVPFGEGLERTKQWVEMDYPKKR